MTLAPKLRLLAMLCMMNNQLCGRTKVELVAEALGYKMSIEYG